MKGKIEESPSDECFRINEHMELEVDMNCLDYDQTRCVSLPGMNLMYIISKFKDVQGVMAFRAPPGLETVNPMIVYTLIPKNKKIFIQIDP